MAGIEIAAEDELVEEIENMESGRPASVGAPVERDIRLSE